MEPELCFDLECVETSLFQIVLDKVKEVAGQRTAGGR